MKKYILLFFSTIVSFQLNAMELIFNIYDFKIDDKIKVVVNPLSGQYYIDLKKYFDPQFTVDNKADRLCNLLKKEIRINKDFPELLNTNSIDSKVTWQLYKNYRDLSHLEPKIKKLLNKSGYKHQELYNLTDFSVNRLTVKKITYNEDALTLKSDYLIVEADKEIKRMIESNSFYAHKNGKFEIDPELDSIFCDLASGFVSIDFKLQSNQNYYTDNNIYPVDSLLTPSQVLNISDLLLQKKEIIVKNTEKKISSLELNQARTILSSIYLSREIEKEGINIEKLVDGEFFDISTALIDYDSGLPIDISSKTANELSEKLLHNTENLLNIPIEHKSQFKLKETLHD